MATAIRPVLKDVYRHWFKGVGARARAPPESVMKRWWGVGLSSAEGEAFDSECSRLFDSTLQAMATGSVRQDAGQYAKQLLRDECQGRDAIDEYEHTLGLILLLDQMSRNVYRNDEAQVVYNLYDRMGLAAAEDALERGVDALQNSDSLAYRLWFYMPLMHSEDAGKHAVVARFLAEVESRYRGEEDKASLKYTNMSQSAAKKHLDILDQFGRYPHRNACLRRQSTPAEAEWLAEGKSYY